MGMGVVMALILQLVKLCIIGFAVTVQGSEGSVISPSPAFTPVIHHRGETPSSIQHGQTWGSSAPSSPSDPDGFLITPSPTTLHVDSTPSEAPAFLPRRDTWRITAPSSPEVPNGSFLHPPVTLPHFASASTPQKIKGIEPLISPSPSTITLLPPSTAQGKVSSPLILPIPPPREAPFGLPVSTPTALGPLSAQGNAPPPSILPYPPPPVSTLATPVPSTTQRNSPPPSTQRNSPPPSTQGNSPPPSILPGPPSPVSTPATPVPSTTQGNSPPPSAQRNAPPPSILLGPPPPVSTPAIPVPSTTQGNSPPPSVQGNAPPSSILPGPPATPVPSTTQGNSPPPSVIPGPPQREVPSVRPPPTAPVSSTAQGNAPPPFIPPAPPQRAPADWPPVSTPTNIVPSTAQGNAPPPPAILLGPPQRETPYVRPPPTAQGNALPPSILPGPPPREVPSVRPPKSLSIAPAPDAIPSDVSPKNSPVSQPIEQGSLPPIVDKGNASTSHTLDPVSPAPAPVAIPSTKLPKISPVGLPKLSPVSPPPTTEHGSLAPTVHERNSNTSHTEKPVSPAPIAVPPSVFPENSPVSQSIHQRSFPPNVHNRSTNKGHTHSPEPIPPHSFASPPWKMENNQPVGHPVFPKITPSIYPAPATSPRIYPINPPLVHSVTPAVSPSKLPVPVVSPALTPRSFHWKEGGAPVSAPLYKTPNPLPAVVHSPAQAPAKHNSRQFDNSPEPLISSPKSPFSKEDPSPAYSPSATFYKRHHTRNIVTSPAPEPSDFVSPPSSEHQDHPIPPSLLPTNGRRHHAPPPVNTGSSVSPFAFPMVSPESQASPSPSPSFKISTHPTKILYHPPKASYSRSSSQSPKKSVLPHVHSLPPPPPNEDCLSTICSEPYANSPPGAPCRCVLPMKVGLRLSVSLYTFFPLVSELASEIATGVFMRQSQVRIMGANAASQDPDKTEALIDLVPLGEEFDNTTAFLTSERFWHKQVVIKASNFGDYEVLYVIYPGLPPSPPLPPSSISIIDGGPYSNNGNNGRMIKPIGVDIPKRHHKGGLNRSIIAIIALSGFLAVVLCFAIVWSLFKYRHHVGQSTSTPQVSPQFVTQTQGAGESSAAGRLVSASSSFQSSIAPYTGSAKTFSMNDIEKATDNFHASRILGEGGFGLVYSGILEDGTKVAVKVLKREDHHGDREFLSEVEMLSRLHHRNLVKLIGICTEVSFRCLVYELIPNGSVESHLHGVDREKSLLVWSARIKIALGAARGLAYLHEDSSPHVIHRDFKSSNILLEEDFTPKVSDFGLARTAADENRHISTRVMGTFGYVAPEYAMTGHLLVKSDVYSYGVVLLELLTGRKPVDMSQPPGQENLVAWARPLLTSKEGLEAIIDPSLGTDVPFDSVAKVAAIASMCVQPEVSDRPFMGEVVQALKLVSNECDEAKEAVSRNSSQEDLSVETVSGQLPDSFHGQFSGTNYASGVDIENGLSASEIFGSSARFRRQTSGSFRRHSYSGPLRTRRSQRLWQIIRRLSGGSVSEHGTMFKL